jgi:hypothetical protein
VRNNTEREVIIITNAPMVNRKLLLSFGAYPVLGRPGVGVVVVVLPFPLGVVHIEPLMVLASKVIAPVCANARPFKVAPVFKLMEVRAKMLPMKLVVVSSVAELPILHHTLHGSPPVTDELDDVTRDDTVLKIQTPDPERVRLPVSKKLPTEQ